MFSLTRTKITHSIILGMLISSASLWAEKASAQTVVDLIKMPIDLIKDKVPTQLPNVNSNAFGNNLNNNSLNICGMPCPQLGGGMAGGGIPQGTAVAPNGAMVPRTGVPVNSMGSPTSAPRPQPAGPTLNLPPIDLQKLF
jgi:hypothetical protein